MYFVRKFVERKFGKEYLSRYVVEKMGTSARESAPDIDVAVIKGITGPLTLVFMGRCFMGRFLRQMWLFFVSELVKSE